VSESESFLSRWSRLKRESGSGANDVEETRADALPGTDDLSSPAFDPASLPPIESIVSDSDIRQFLHASVPAELTRAALRAAWTADPAIRDFIGIADNQWDFNAPATIPGFSSLGPADYARGLVARAPGSLHDGVEGTPDNSHTAEHRAVPGSDSTRTEPVDEVWQVATPPAPSDHDADPAGQVGERPGVHSGTGMEAAEVDSGPPATRSHGGALPR
jgi:hypothetical protein